MRCDDDYYDGYDDDDDYDDNNGNSSDNNTNDADIGIPNDLFIIIDVAVDIGMVISV